MEIVMEEKTTLTKEQAIELLSRAEAIVYGGPISEQLAWSIEEIICNDMPFWHLLHEALRTPCLWDEMVKPLLPEDLQKKVFEMVFKNEIESSDLALQRLLTAASARGLSDPSILDKLANLLPE